MNDTDAALAILSLLADVNDDMPAWLAEPGRGFIDWDTMPVNPNQLSSGEDAVLDLAKAVYRWLPISYTGLGSLSPSWKLHILAVITERLTANGPRPGNVPLQTRMTVTVSEMALNAID